MDGQTDTCILKDMITISIICFVVLSTAGSWVQHIPQLLWSELGACSNARKSSRSARHVARMWVSWRSVQPWNPSWADSKQRWRRIAFNWVGYRHKWMANMIKAWPMDARGGFWWKHERSMKFSSTLGGSNRTCSNYEVKLLENQICEMKHGGWKFQFYTAFLLPAGHFHRLVCGGTRVAAEEAWQCFRSRSCKMGRRRRFDQQ